MAHKLVRPVSEGPRLTAIVSNIHRRDGVPVLILFVSAVDINTNCSSHLRLLKNTYLSIERYTFRPENALHTN